MILSQITSFSPYLLTNLSFLGVGTVLMLYLSFSNFKQFIYLSLSNATCYTFYVIHYACIVMTRNVSAVLENNIFCDLMDSRVGREKLEI